ncbi:MAG TPA: response regulator transcription factor [Bacteroidia bacterium]|nr:response regulator transcription factor [Bacteroidia bacterium]
MKILIIEDEAELLVSVKSYLASEGFLCETAADFDSAILLIDMYDYDCFVVDLALPKGNGLDVIERIKKKNSNAGIIIISAKNSIDDKLKGLELGSDDYLTKPFHLSELNARIKAVLRRRNFDGKNVASYGDLKIDLNAHHVFINENEIILTHKEYELLLYFLSNRNKVLPKAAIAEHLLGNYIDQADSFDFIYSHIKNLRKKIMDSGGADPIKTIYGLGYKFLNVESA